MKKNFLAAAVLLPLALSSCSEAEHSGIRVTASFYPVYIIAENVVGEVPGIDLRSMAQPQTGCLHDYQLTTADMRSLEDTDLFIVNGGGMESFLDNALELFPELDVIDTSAGVTSLDGHDHGHTGHDHGENSHYWMYPENAVVQAENICGALSEICPEYADEFRQNTDAFKESVSGIETFDGKGISVCVFNEAFEYLHLSYGFDVAAVVEMDENETPSAKELAEIITEINEGGIDLLIAADDASKTVADTIARETGAGVVVLDPVLTGDPVPERYTEAMNENARILKGSVYK
ncbi:MAG TPA: metal ABC transporter substrate-binding protein [Firmicutes bacterium]|nr:metal ABC transporter substrate-binding protein [Bacillota bacterium]